MEEPVEAQLPSQPQLIPCFSNSGEEEAQLPPLNSAFRSKNILMPNPATPIKSKTIDNNKTSIIAIPFLLSVNNSKCQLFKKKWIFDCADHLWPMVQNMIRALR